ncbi:PREDICTED: ninjurin-1-like [Nicrophorus vespilloides]|uniref:Ninjurin-1-like n=1 Tax=Nicrophorus vespilloides TaxID=110193 RepID=A0ABM1MXC3_NICVS|nr:PREDICTED: ninjurin-1-like [Nicrophorus vespilloides]
MSASEVRLNVNNSHVRYSNDYDPLSLTTDDKHDNKEAIEDIIYPEENETLEAIPNEDDKNALAAFKTSAQGMMDIALLTSNANQLRYLTMLNQRSAFYTLLIILISTSLFLQVAVGVCLIVRAMGEYKNQPESAAVKHMNIFGTCAVYAILIINVFIASFTDIPAPLT